MVNLKGPDKANLMEYIKIQWADIHHSRNQDWKILLIILSIFYALLNVNFEQISLRIGITLLGLIASAIGVYISLMHWRLLYSKIRLIKACENALGIRIKFSRPRFPVQGVILLIYLLIGSAFLAYFVWLVCCRRSWLLFTAFGICFLASIVICFFATRIIRKELENDAPMVFENMGE